MFVRTEGFPSRIPDGDVLEGGRGVKDPDGTAAVTDPVILPVVGKYPAVHVEILVEMGPVDLEEVQPRDDEGSLVIPFVGEVILIRGFSVKVEISIGDGPEGGGFIGSGRFHALIQDDDVHSVDGGGGVPDGGAVHVGAGVGSVGKDDPQDQLITQLEIITGQIVRGGGVLHHVVPVYDP